MSQTLAFKTTQGQAEYLKAYDAAMASWPIPYEETEIPGRFGVTHVITCGSKDAPPLVLLHGFMVTSTMWSPNIEEFSRNYRVYAIDTLGQPSKSVPNLDDPIRNTEDFVEWLGATLNALGLDRIELVGMSTGGWIALNFALVAPERVKKLVLLSPAACFLPLDIQFTLRSMLMMYPTRLGVNSFMGWMGFKDTPGDRAARSVIDLMYLGVKHFRLPQQTMRIRPSMFSDEELQSLKVPVLLLIGEDEVIYDAARALDRANRLVSVLEGELVPRCKHDMYLSQYRIVNPRVLTFLRKG